MELTNFKLIEKDFIENPRSLKVLAEDYNTTVKKVKQIFSENYYYFDGGVSPERSIKNHDALVYWINNQNELVYSIARKFEVNGDSLMRKIKKLGYEPIKQTDPKFNVHIFDTIDTEEKAYWLGFIWADGCVYKAPLNNGKYTAYNFELGLSYNDYDHLIKFKNFIECSKDIYIDECKKPQINPDKTYKRCRICLTNQYFWNSLVKLGCNPDKTHVCYFPERAIFKSESLIYDFIRGFIDGDGCLSWGNNGTKRIPQLSILGTPEMLIGICHYLGFNSFNKCTDTEVIKSLKYNGNKAIKIEKKLYESATIYLNRKYERFLEHCRFVEESTKELQTNIGESCDANTEISIETKESIPSYSVEIEPEKSE